jgi:hypothetical protein
MMTSGHASGTVRAMETDRLSLREAMATGRLEEFIRQEEARGVGRANRHELDEAIRELAKRRRPGDRTSRSASRGGSRGK